MSPSAETMQEEKKTDPTLDRLLLIVVATALVSAYVYYLFEVPNGTKIPWDRVRITIVFAIIFGTLLAKFRAFWKNSFFWLSFCAAILFHLFLTNLPQLNAVPLGPLIRLPLAGIELWVLFFIFKSKFR